MLQNKVYSTVLLVHSTIGHRTAAAEHVSDNYKRFRICVQVFEAPSAIVTFRR